MMLPEIFKCLTCRQRVLSGVDLYAKDENNNWVWDARKFSFGDTIVYRFNNLSPVKRKYVLYLPLYNTVKWMQIAVPKENVFIPLPARKENPIVVYGASSTRSLRIKTRTGMDKYFGQKIK